MTELHPLLLVVAGHDPSGAGIDADRDAAQELPFEFAGVVTANTEQDAGGVRAIGARPARKWLLEAFAFVLGDVRAVKFGLLPGAEHVLAALDLVRALRERHGADFPVVVDPVLAASSGGRFLDADAVKTLKRELLPARVVLTPNLDELAELTARDPRELARALEPRLAAARDLCALGAAAVIAKGGHGGEDPVRDLVVRADGRYQWLLHPRVKGGKIRGSGCRYSTRLAARLGQGWTLETAAEEAARHVATRIAAGGTR
ncbi:MAG: bifunctional hydroxymethylpyrimidine kinase/phosphomethylpyrimidine kinase [Planctomycetes bacterium]|nr:bifunctional hydroxymethylpyrimidine kinase/phosphomethylpyrimidine kinase [Planctomycetota bacterium]